MKKSFKNQKGITLIALVITIIVLLILAGVSISMISSQDGILNKAVTAKEKTKIASDEEKVKLAIQAAMMNENGEIDYENIDSYLSGATADKDAKVIKYKGNNYLISEDGDVKQVAWYVSKNNEEKYVVTNGTKEILLGATVNYDPYTGADSEKLTATPNKEKLGYENSTYTIANNKEQKLTWKVIGTDDDGDILIIPTTNVKDSTGTIQKLQIGGDDVETGLKSAQYAAEEVNRICAIYGYGKGAKSARSLQVEDIDKLTEFDKTEYNKDNVSGYGHNVTYTKTANGIDYTWNGKTQSTGYSDFTYLDEKTGEVKTLNQGESKTVKSTYYYYEMSSYKQNLTNKNVYELITADTDYSANPYWLGSSYVYANSRCAYFELRRVRNSGVRIYSFAGSGGDCGDNYYGLRPAVSLESDGELVHVESDGSYNISIK